MILFNKKALRRFICLASLIHLLLSTSHAQPSALRNFSAGYRLSERTPTGNNPFMIGPLIKDKQTYQELLFALPYNGIIGNPSSYLSHTFYLNTEWQKEQSGSRFWRRHTITAGVLATAKATRSVGQLEYKRYFITPDTGYIQQTYSVTQKQQLFGLNIGLNRIFPVAKKTNIIAGLHMQTAIAAIHSYQHQQDSNVFRPAYGWKAYSTALPDLEGTSFVQWQLLLPIGIEYYFFKQQLGIRLETNVGYADGPSSSLSRADNFFAGMGAWLIYQPAQRRGR